MTMPLVSIMIPTYNQSQYLEEAIKSALAQTYSPLEIVISDDASTDPDVANVLNNYKNESRILIYNGCKNIGRAKNYRQNLYERVSGEWVINLDGDDFFYDKNFIRRAVSLILKKPNIIMVSGRQLQLDEESKKIFQNDRNDGPERVMNSEQAYNALLKETYYYWHATTVYHRRTAMKIGFYRHDMTATDDDSFLRLMAYGDVGVIPLWGAVWRKHNDNVSRNQPVEAMIKNLKALMAPKDLIDLPPKTLKVPRRFLIRWMKKHLINRTKPNVRILLKERDSLYDYLRYVWAVTSISPYVGGWIFFRPKNILRALRRPFCKAYNKMMKKEK